jgi:hypothetical protein
MSNLPIIAYPRHVYESYHDLRRLVELAQFPVCYVDEIDPGASGAVYILPIQNSEVDAAGAHWRGAKARIIRWLFEWFEYPDVPGVEETWCSDPWWSEKINARYVPLGSDKRLRDTNPGKNAQIAYDAAYMGYFIGRREKIWNELNTLGVTLSPKSAWGTERDAILNASRVYLQVHQRPEARTIAPLRVVVAAAYRLPYITETVESRGILYHNLMTCAYSFIPQFVRNWTKEPSTQLADMGLGLYQTLCVHHPFDQTVLNSL